MGQRQQPYPPIQKTMKRTFSNQPQSNTPINEQLQKSNENNKNQTDVLSKQLATMANTFKLRFSRGPNVVLKSYNFTQHYNQIIASYGSQGNSYFVKGTEANVDERRNYS